MIKIHSTRQFRITVVILLFTLSFSLSAKDQIIGQSAFLQGNYDNLFITALNSAVAKPEKAYLPLIIASEMNDHYLSRIDIGNKELNKLYQINFPDPVAKDLIIQMQADRLGAKGRQTDATALRRSRGIIPLWRIAGPFGRYDNSSFYNSFKPEKTIDFSIFMKGFSKDVTWRLLSENVCLNNFTPYKWISPQRGVIYLYTQFKLKKEQKIILEKNGNGSCKFWVDGFSAGKADIMKEETANIIRFKSPERLTAGWHRLLVKIYSSDHNNEFIFRLLNSHSEPLEEVDYDLKKLHGANNFGTKKWSKETYNLTEYTLAEQALYYQYQQMYDKSLTLWEQAIQQNPQQAALKIYYAMCASQAKKILPGPMRESIIQRQAQKALETDKNAVSALLLLGEYERRHKRFHEAGKYFKQALQINPKALMIHGARIRMALENNWSAEIIDWLDKFRELYPQSYLLKLLEGMYYNNLGYVKKAADALAQAKKMNQENITVSTDTIKSYFAGGAIEKALQHWESIPLYLQERADLLILYSEILSRLKEKDNALNAITKALNAVGSDTVIKRKEADIYYTSNRDKDALTTYQQSLNLDPGNHYLRRLINRLEGKDYQFWNKYMLDPFTEIEKFAHSNKTYRGRTARLIDQTVLTLYPGGAYANYTHELQTVLTDSGISQAAQINTDGQLLQARTILPERGTTLEPLILPGNKIITMPAVTRGVSVDHAYLVEESAPGDRSLNFPKWYFRSPKSEESFLFSQYILRVPPNVDFTFATRNLGEKVEFTTFEDEDGIREFIWTGKDMPEAIHEEGSPAIGSTLPFVQISSNRSWEDIYRAMSKVYIGKTIPTTAIKNKVNELTEELTSTSEKISAIHKFVCQEVLFNTSRAPASHVFLQRLGDRNLLALAMLKAANIKADLVAARPPANILYQPIWKLPDAHSFTEYFIRTSTPDNKVIWMDLRGKYSQAGSIGEDYAGGTGFILGKEKGEFVILPQATEQNYTIIRDRKYTIYPHKNKLELTGNISYYGTRGWKFKENMAALPKQKQSNVIAEIMMKSLFGINIKKFDLPDLKESGKPFTIRYKAEVEDLIRKQQDGGYGIPFALPEIELLPSRNSNRRLTPYHLNKFIAATDTYTYLLPKATILKNPPDDVIIRSKFGLYQLIFTIDDNKIIMKRKYLFKPQIITLNDWESYRELAMQINKIETDYIWFDKLNRD